MNFVETLALAFAVAVDCFAVAIASGIIYGRLKWKPMMVMAISFGFFQGLFPFFGWWGTSCLHHLIESVDHWIAFGLLAFIGIRMILESAKEEEEKHFNPHDYLVILTMAVATSIDALAVGISFACMGIIHFSDLIGKLLAIGIVSSGMTVLGLFLGVRFGKRFSRKIHVDLIGGIVLVAIGAKVLYEHLSAGI